MFDFGVSETRLTKGKEKVQRLTSIKQTHGQGKRDNLSLCCFHKDRK